MNMFPTMQRQASSDSRMAMYYIEEDSGLQVLIASTPQTIKIMNEPELCGLPFQDTLSYALYEVIRYLHEANEAVGQAMRDNPLDVLYILRGGLNFDLHRSLTKTTLKMPEVSFVSSQRIGTNGAFTIGESSYEKWSIQSNSLLCVGDICATGTTLINSLDRLFARYDIEEKKPKWLLIITVGTFESLARLRNYCAKLLDAQSPYLEGLTVVFLEQLFSLYRGGDQLAPSHLSYTDFFRQNPYVAIEFEIASLNSYLCFLERCAIYDGGSRAFEPNIYLHNLKNYWVQFSRLSQTLDMASLLRTKTSLFDYRQGFANWCQGRPWAHSTSTSVLQDMYERGNHALEQLLATPLADICEERIVGLGAHIEE